MSMLDHKIVEYLAQEQRGVSFTWLMAFTGQSVNEVAASVVKLEEAGFVSSGTGKWPEYSLVEDVPLSVPLGYGVRKVVT